MKKQNNFFNTIILSILTIIVIQSCGTIDPCPPNQVQGNPGSIFNTEQDEYSPLFWNDAMYFTGVRDDADPKEQIFKSEIKNGKIQPPVVDNSLPMSKIPNSGLPQFNLLKDGNVELFFVGMTIKSKRKNSDLFYSIFNGKTWSEPISISPNINTEGYESYPAISKNGDMLAFVSDRSGGIGGLDLYLSLRSSDGNWSEAKNLGSSINTDKSENSPYFDENDNLYFSSKGYKGYGNYDIIKAIKTAAFEWSNPKVLPYPINSEFHDIGPALWNNNVYLASDRKGGCGGKDIYTFNLCGSVILACKVSSEKGNISPKGTIKVFDEDRNSLANMEVKNDGWIEIPLEANKGYILQYFNSCVPNYVPEQKFIAPCSDSTIVKMLAEFEIPSEMRKFDFGEYKVPFFVTGYYQPNTSDILQTLRMKFNYNLLGNDASTKYIENPGPAYDDYAKTVETALNEAANFILNMITNLNDECKKSQSTLLNVSVIGFSDQRAISEIAKYNDDSIDDERFGIKISKGDKIDNLELSKLRAYFTAKFLENKLQNNNEYENFKDKIKWNVDGKGIDETDKLNELKRRVNIEIGVQSKN